MSHINPVMKHFVRVIVLVVTLLLVMLIVPALSENDSFSILTYDYNDEYRNHYMGNISWNGPTSTVQIIPGEPLTIQGLSRVVFPYSFSGWNADPDATEAEYMPGDKYTGEDSTTLYAVWKEPYDLGMISGESSFSKPQYCYESPLWLKFKVSESGTYLFETTGGFAYWTYSSDHGVYTETQEHISNYRSKGSDLLIWADLQADTQYYLMFYSNGIDLNLNVKKINGVYTLTYEYNEEYRNHFMGNISWYGTSSTDQIIPGEPLSIIAFDKEVFPYSFVGWSSDPNATTAEYYPNDLYLGEESETLYAVWNEPYDLGEIFRSGSYVKAQYCRNCPFWLKFTVAESGTYMFKTSGGFAYYMYNSNHGIYTENQEQISSYREKDGDLQVWADLEANTQYYLMFYSNGKDLNLDVDKIVETYTITYDYNEKYRNYYMGDISLNDSTYSVEVTPGELLTVDNLTKDVFSYSFIGWSTDPYATEAVYKPGDQFACSGSATLYAVWKEPKNLGVISPETNYETDVDQYCYCCPFWQRFMVSEGGTYLFETTGGFAHSMYSSAHGIYTENQEHISSYREKDSDLLIWADLQANTQYYLMYYSNGTDLKLNVRKISDPATHTDPPPDTNPEIPTDLTSDILSLPNNLCVIEANCFQGGIFTKVVCPATLERIESGAFADCRNLLQVVIPSTSTTIDKTAFDGCGKDLIIIAPEQSYAHTFAKENGIKFEEYSY